MRSSSKLERIQRRLLPGTDEEIRERQLLCELRNETSLKRASRVTAKKERTPKVDLDTHPFCASRQLADEWQLQNFNRNPRYYRTELTNSPRVQKNYHNYSAIYSNNEQPNEESYSPRDKMNFDTLTVPTSLKPVFKTPQARYQNQKISCYVTTKSLPKSYSQTTLKSVTFGHRPKSASRHFDPLSTSVHHAAKGVVGGRVLQKNKTLGMSAVDLQSLLKTTENESVMGQNGHVYEGGHSSSLTRNSLHYCSPKTKTKPKRKLTSSHSSASILTDDDYDRIIYQNSLNNDLEEANEPNRSSNMRKVPKDKLELGFNNRVYNPVKELPQKERVAVNGSSKNVDLSVAELLSKYRKMSVGEL